jgi:hypothetical protein
MACLFAIYRTHQVGKYVQAISYASFGFACSFQSSALIDEMRFLPTRVELLESNLYVPATSGDDNFIPLTEQPSDDDLDRFPYPSAGLTIGPPIPLEKASGLPGDRAGSWTLHLTFTQPHDGLPSPYSKRDDKEEVVLRPFREVPNEAVIVTGPIVDIQNFEDVFHGSKPRKAVRVFFLASDEEIKKYGWPKPFNNMNPMHTIQYGQ